MDIRTVLAAAAAEARIGVQTETSSIDPHYAVVAANQAIAANMFESLLTTDAALRPVAGRRFLSQSYEFKSVADYSIGPIIRLDRMP